MAHPTDERLEELTDRLENGIKDLFASERYAEYLAAMSKFHRYSYGNAIVNNLSDFIFAAIKAIGIIILGWGVVQVGMSVQSHDASQRSQGFLCLFGGLLIAFAKEILTTIGAV